MQLELLKNKTGRILATVSPFFDTHQRMCFFGSSISDTFQFDSKIVRNIFKITDFFFVQRLFFTPMIVYIWNPQIDKSAQRENAQQWNKVAEENRHEMQEKSAAAKAGKSGKPVACCAVM